MFDFFFENNNKSGSSETSKSNNHTENKEQSEGPINSTETQMSVSVLSSTDTGIRIVGEEQNVSSTSSISTQTANITTASVSKVQTTNKKINQPHYLEVRDSQGKTSLHHAAEKNNASMLISMLSLLEKGSSYLNIQDNEGNTPLHYAVMKPEKDMSSALIGKGVSIIEKGASIDSQNNLGETPLHSAVINNSESNVDHLLTCKPNLKLSTNKKARIAFQTPLHYAFKNKVSKNIIESLLKVNLDINALDGFYQTPFFLLLQNRDDLENLNELITTLLPKANLIVTSASNESIVHVATSNSTISDKTYQQIVENCVKASKTNFVDLRDNNGMTALHLAVKNKLNGRIKILFENKASLNIQNIEGDTPLHLAIKNKAPLDLIQMLIDARTDLKCQNNRGETPLHLAALYQREDVVEKLLENTHKEDLKSVTKSQRGSSFSKGADLYPGGSTALHYVFYGETVSANIVNQLIIREANINFQDEDGRTPFYLAVTHSNPPELNWDSLLKRVDLTIVTKKKETVLYAAAQNKKIDSKLFQKILEGYVKQYVEQYKGTKIPATDQQTVDGDTILYAAVESEDKEKINTVLAYTPNPNLFNNHRIPLIRAIQKKDYETAVKLMICGADVEAKDNEGKNALYYATVARNIELMSKLYEKGARLTEEEGKEGIKRALLGNRIDVVMKLIKFGADPFVHIFLIVKSAKTSSLLSSLGSVSSSDDYGYRVNDQTKCLEEGDTPLHYAVRMGNKDLAEKCLEANPKILYAENAAHKNPIHTAIEMLDSEMAHLLWDYCDKIPLSQQTPGVADPSVPSYYHSEKKAIAYLSLAMSYDFETKEQLDNFFAVPEYELSEKQKKKREQIQEQIQEQIKEAQNVRKPSLPVAVARNIPQFSGIISVSGSTPTSNLILGLVRKGEELPISSAEISNNNNNSLQTSTVEDSATPKPSAPPTSESGIAVGSSSLTSEGTVGVVTSVEMTTTSVPTNVI